MIQDLLGNAIPAFKETKSWSSNVIGSAIACALWGYLLFAGVVDPLGGIWTMWPLFGATNQMLAAIALTLCTVVLFKMKRERFAWVTLVPTTWLVICTVTAGLEKVFNPNPAVGFLSHALKFGNAAASNKVLAPAKSLADMNRIVFNDYFDATLAGLSVTIVLIVVIRAIFDIRKALSTPKGTAIEIGGASGAALGGGGND
jgi:carbon starvation protein